MQLFPLETRVHPKLPVGIFGGAILFVTVASWLLPETKDLEMADVVNDVEEHGTPTTATI